MSIFFCSSVKIIQKLKNCHFHHGRFLDQNTLILLSKFVVHKLAQYRKSNDVAMSLYSVICVMHTFTSHSSIIRVITATRHKQNWCTCAGQQLALTTRASHIIQHYLSCPLTKVGVKQCHTSWRREDSANMYPTVLLKCR